MALAFLAFGLWLRLGRLERTTLRGWLFVPISVVAVLLPHLRLGPARPDVLFGRAVRLHDRGRSWLRAGFEAALHTSVMALAAADHADLAQRDSRRRDRRLVRLGAKWHWIYSALRDRWKWFDIGSLIVAAPGVPATRSSAASSTLSRNLAFSAIVLRSVFVLLPRIMFGSAYADMRLVPYLMAVALLAIRFRGAPDRRPAQVLAVSACCSSRTRTVANTISLGHGGQRPESAKLKAIDLMPAGRARDQPRRNERARNIGRCCATATSARWSSSAGRASRTTNG